MSLKLKKVVVDMILDNADTDNPKLKKVVVDMILDRLLKNIL